MFQMDHVNPEKRNSEAHNKIQFKIVLTFNFFTNQFIIKTDK